VHVTIRYSSGATAAAMNMVSAMRASFLAPIVRNHRPHILFLSLGTLPITRTEVDFPVSVPNGTSMHVANCSMAPQEPLCAHSVPCDSVCRDIPGEDAVAKFLADLPRHDAAPQTAHHAVRCEACIEKDGVSAVLWGRSPNGFRRINEDTIQKWVGYAFACLLFAGVFGAAYFQLFNVKKAHYRRKVDEEKSLRFVYLTLTSQSIASETGEAEPEWYGALYVFGVMFTLYIVPLVIGATEPTASKDYAGIACVVFLIPGLLAVTSMIRKRASAHTQHVAGNAFDVPAEVFWVSFAQSSYCVFLISVSAILIFIGFGVDLANAFNPAVRTIISGGYIYVLLNTPHSDGRITATIDEVMCQHFACILYLLHNRFHLDIQDDKFVHIHTIAQNEVAEYRYFFASDNTPQRVKKSDDAYRRSNDIPSAISIYLEPLIAVLFVTCFNTAMDTFEEFSALVFSALVSVSVVSFRLWPKVNKIYRHTQLLTSCWQAVTNVSVFVGLTIRGAYRNKKLTSHQDFFLQQARTLPLDQKNYFRAFYLAELRYHLRSPRPEDFD
jgi:hypothetical protein